MIFNHKTMLLPIYLYGHPVLRKEAEVIDESAKGEELTKLIADMWETMYNSEGVGLAAPQVGKSIRLVVLDGSALAEKFPECADSKMCLINPELEPTDDAQLVSLEEGCLSVPGLSESVKRPDKIILNWLDENFQEHEQVFTGFLARIIQHECDHLEGTVYTDRISPIRKQLIKSKLANIVKGRVACDYRTKPAPKK